MKTSRNILSALIAAGAPGVLLLALGNWIPADLSVAGLTVIGLIAFAIFDYSRPVATLRVPGVVLRPTLPGAVTPAQRGARRAA
jgi:hypothetical protein